MRLGLPPELAKLAESMGLGNDPRPERSRQERQETSSHEKYRKERKAKNKAIKLSRRKNRNKT